MTRHPLNLLRMLIERSPRLSMTYRSTRDTWNSFDTPVKTPMGFYFLGNPAMQQGRFEPEESDLVRKVLPTVDLVINVGANIGYYCCISLNAGKDVIAFEPVDSNLKLLLKNIKLNDWGERAEVYPLALSNKTSVINIYGGGTGASILKGWSGTSERFSSLAPCSTANTVLGDRILGKRCFIIVDVEGAEKMLLEGAPNLLNSNPMPIWMMEITVNEHQPDGHAVNPNLVATFEHFWNTGYQAWTAVARPRLVSAAEVSSIAKGGPDTIGTRNFLFIENGREQEYFPG